MGISAGELSRINSFPKLIDVLRDHLEWPIGEAYEFDEVVFEYEARELGLKPEETARIREIHQLRPLVTHQPWGVFFISLEEKALPVTVLRRILKALILNRRGQAKTADRQAWHLNDLIFAASFGKSGTRELAFIHFSDGKSIGDLPVMKVLGWNARDTVLKHEYVAATLRDKLSWPDDPEDAEGWRKDWASAFELRLNETIRTSKDLAIRLAWLASEIRARANQLLGAEDDTGPMRTMLTAFRKNLIHDLDDDGFADMFAQTIAYGMLAARISRPGALLVADNLADMIPKTNPFLKELFESFLKLGGRDKRQGMDFDELGVRDVVDMLNTANMEAVLRDFGDRNPKEDPVIHFYELFLKEYDPKKRMQRGVFYTPRPVVNFIVRGVDEILRTEFGLPLGVADTSTWSEVAARNGRITIPAHVKPDAPFVQILDPATGTGTFLVEVIDLIHKRMEEHWEGQGKSKAEIEAAWNAYVPAHLLPRLTAFELMMAPYTIAHMKVGLKLSETGYTFGSEERARIFLTNALEPARDLDMEFIFMSEALAHEAQASNTAKAKTPFTVIVGNPPYSLQSANLEPEHRKLIEKFKYVNGIRITERNALQMEKNLNDDYVKFIARSMDILSDQKFFCIGIITNHSFLDNPTMRGMRAKLISDFGRCLFLDLHGNSTKGEVAPDNKQNENIFEIKQGVAISLLREFGASSRRVEIAEHWGTREEKEEFLLNENVQETASSVVSPVPPLFRLSTENLSLAHELSESCDISELFKSYGAGFISARDNLVVDFDRDALIARIKRFQQSRLSDADLLSEFDVSAKKGWNATAARSRLSSIVVEDHIRLIRYRPFDNRWMFYDSSLVWGCSWPTAQHLVAEAGNLALLATRITKDKWDVTVSDRMASHKAMSAYDSNIVFPLWLKPSAGELRRRPNIDRAWALDLGTAIGLSYVDGVSRGDQKSFGPDFRQAKAEQLGLLDADWEGRGDLQTTFGPRNLFEYIYAVLHSPGYRSRYAEFLKSDFPRIPRPKDRTSFTALVELGRRLLGLHLLRPEEVPNLTSPEIRFAGSGEARVEKGYPEYKNGKVMINATRWFEDVPRATWQYHVGGYQVCEKWLKDRAGKGGKNPSVGHVLTDEDIMHYRRVVVALTETRRQMDEIDEVIDRHGGWPDAFYVPPPPPPTIEQIIKADEGQELEYKSTLQFDLKEAAKSKLVRKAALKTIVAFLNSGRGSLVIGVSDEKEIVGLEPDFSTMSPERQTKEWFQQTLVNLINEQIGSEFAPLYEVRFATHEEKIVAIVDVKERGPKPAYLKDGGTQEFYVRTSNLTKQLKSEEIDRYISTHWRG